MLKSAIPSIRLISAAALITLGLSACASNMQSIHPSAFVVPQPPKVKHAAVADASKNTGRALPQVSATASVGPSAPEGAESTVAGGYAHSLGSDLSPVQAAQPLPPGEKLSVAALLGSVEGRPIFVQTIFNMVDGDLKREAAESRTQHYFEQQALATLERAIHNKVDTMLLLEQARRRLTSDQKKQIAAYVRVREAKLLAQYMGSEERANRALKRQGTSLDRHARPTPATIPVTLVFRIKARPAMA